MPRATQAIIGANVVVFLLQMSMGDSAMIWFALWPLNASAVYGPEIGFALPAFWVGLLYDQTALDAAWDLVKNWSMPEREKLRVVLGR